MKPANKKVVKYRLVTPAHVARCAALVAEIVADEARPVCVEIIPWEARRTLNQNSMFYALYQQIASQCEDSSIHDVRRACKLNYGVPILLAEDEEFRAAYSGSLMPQLPYAQQLLAMDILSVTSRMKKRQGRDYIDMIIREYSQAGYSLVHPGEL